MTRLRLSWANVPVLSLLSFRWMVLRGSEVMDYALTRRAAERRRNWATWTIEKARP